MLSRSKRKERLYFLHLLSKSRDKYKLLLKIVFLKSRDLIFVWMITWRRWKYLSTANLIWKYGVETVLLTASQIVHNCVINAVC